ncbi:PAS domain S-box protein [Nocardioides pacificus]
MQQLDPAWVLASLGATTAECVLVLTMDGQILWASEATERVMGWKPDDLVGRRLAEFAARADVGSWDTLSARLLAGQTVGRFTEFRHRLDDRIVETVITLAPVHDDAGALVGVTTILRDVTRELNDRRQLELAYGRFEQVMTPQALFDLDGRMTSVNRAWCALFGRPEADFIGEDILSLVHPLDLDNATTQLAPMRQGTVESVSYQAVFRDGAGRSLPLLVDATSLRDRDGRPYGVAAFARDLREVREARSRMASQANMFLALGRRSWDAAIVTDAEFNPVYVSPPAARLLGYDAEEIVIDVGWDFIHPDDLAKMMPLVEAVIAEPLRTERFLVRVQDAAGRWRWFEETLTNCLADRDIGGLVLNLRDITDQVETDRAIRLSEARHRAIVETAQEGILATSPDGTTMFANEKMAELLDLDLDRLYGMDARALLQRNDGTEPSWSGEGIDRYETTYALPHGGERIFEVSHSPLRDDGAEPLGWLCMVSDVTESRAAERKLRQQALHDPLTGLPNRYLFLDRLEMAAARRRRVDETSTSVLFLDVDGLKPLNDSHGHEAGDLLLRHIGARLVDAVRGSDTVARLGGDEFAIVCEDTDEAAALVVAQRIHESLVEPIRIEEIQVRVTVSIGVAASPPHVFGDLVRLADSAMYEAKRLGDGQTVVARVDAGSQSPTS